jgi:hypothetical protein
MKTETQENWEVLHTHNETNPVIWITSNGHFIAEVSGSDLADRIANLPVLERENTEIKKINRELVKALERITHQEQSRGREGCTWGDTDFDSLSATAGYNQALENVSEIANKALELAARTAGERKEK